MQYILNYFTVCCTGSSSDRSILLLFASILISFSLFLLPATLSKSRLPTINTKSSGTEACHIHSLLRLVTTKAQKPSSEPSRVTLFLFKNSREDRGSHAIMYPQPFYLLCLQPFALTNQTQHQGLSSVFDCLACFVFTSDPRKTAGFKIPLFNLILESTPNNNCTPSRINY